MRKLTMAVLFDRNDNYACAQSLILAKVRGEISLTDLEGIVELGIEAFARNIAEATACQLPLGFRPAVLG